MVSRSRQSLNRMTTDEVFSDLRSDYNAAKTSYYRRRRTGIAATGSGADYHYRSDADYLRMMELARDFDRNDVIVGQGIDRLVDNLVQDGFTLDPQTGDGELDKDLSGRWKSWSEDPDQCDLSGRFDFHDMERFIPRSTIVDGDIFVVPHVDGPLKLFEAHRCRRPINTRRKNVVHGVMIDEHRRPIEYWLTKEDIDPLRPVQRVGEIQPYPARDEDGNPAVFHCYNPKRVSATRGVTSLAPTADVIGMSDDLHFAMLVKAKMASCFAFLHEYGAGVEMPDDTQQRGERISEILADGTTRTREGIAPGMDVHGFDGEKITGFSPNIPNPEYFDHAHLLLTFIAVNLGLPLAVLLLDPSNTNFSGWRGAIDQARIGFRRWQRWEVRRFHRPVYRHKVRQWMADDPALRRAAEKSGVNIFAHRWNPPTWAYIEPLKDASADLLRVRNSLISHRRRCHERGMDWGDLSTEIVEDNALMIEKAYKKAEELNKAFKGLNVTWREVASLPTPDGVKVTVDSSFGQPEGDPNTANREGKQHAA